LTLPPVADLSARIGLELLAGSRRGALRGPLANLNFPERWTGELRATRLGAQIYEEVVDFRVDPRGREYLWLGGPGVRHERDAGTDTDAYDDGAASITPLLLDLTSPADGAAMTSLVERVVAKRTERA
jgi:5'-nucleotidase